MNKEDIRKSIEDFGLYELDGDYVIAYKSDANNLGVGMGYGIYDETGRDRLTHSAWTEEEVAPRCNEKLFKVRIHLDHVTQLVKNNGRVRCTYFEVIEVLNIKEEAKRLLKKHKLASSYWGRRIILAEKFGGFTICDKAKAGFWITCACGRLGDGVPRLDWPQGKPIDRVLRNLGYDFNNAVANSEYLEAVNLLIKIENRARKVIAKNVSKVALAST